MGTLGERLTFRRWSRQVLAVMDISHALKFVPLQLLIFLHAQKKASWAASWAEFRSPSMRKARLYAIRWYRSTSALKQATSPSWQPRTRCASSNFPSRFPFWPLV